MLVNEKVIKLFLVTNLISKVI